MSNPYYWAKIEYQGAASRLADHVHVDPGRNAEKLSLIVSIGSRSSILGGPVERNYVN